MNLHCYTCDGKRTMRYDDMRRVWVCPDCDKAALCPECMSLWRDPAELDALETRRYRYAWCRRAYNHRIGGAFAEYISEAKP